MEFAQCGGMDEDEALYGPEDKYRIYRHYSLGSAILGPGDLCELYILQQHQRYLLEDESIRGSVSVTILSLSRIVHF